MVVPENGKLEKITTNSLAHNATEHISSPRSAPKAIIAILQVIYAAITLYQARGKEIQEFGYAAFGLTVTPYLVMSLINLLAQILTPEYSSLFLVSSEVSDEAERRGGTLVGFVEGLAPPLTSVTGTEPYSGTFSTASEATPSDPLAWPKSLVCEVAQTSAQDELDIRIVEASAEFTSPLPILELPSHPLNQAKSEAKLHVPPETYGPIVFFLTLLLVNGLLSGFRMGDSTPAQRGWTMSWLVVGNLAGIMMHAYLQIIRTNMANMKNEWTTVELAVNFTSWLLGGPIPLIVPAIGGFVTVAQELYQYGICSKV